MRILAVGGLYVCFFASMFRSLAILAYLASISPRVDVGPYVGELSLMAFATATPMSSADGFVAFGIEDVVAEDVIARDGDLFIDGFGLGMYCPP